MWGAAKELGFGEKSEAKAKEAAKAKAKAKEGTKAKAKAEAKETTKAKGGKPKSDSIVAQPFPKMDRAKDKGNNNSAANNLLGNNIVAGTTSSEARQTNQIPHIIGSAPK